MPSSPAGLGTADKLSASMDRYLGVTVGNIAHCEGGRLVITNDYARARAYDNDGRLLKEFTGFGNHHTNFLDAMRSRRESDLKGPLLQGHRSSALVHLANLSYRTGRAMAPGDIRDQLAARSALTEPYGRFTEHLAANKVDLGQTPATLGAPLTFDAATERFTGENSEAANKLRSREYRAPWIVPQLA